MPPPHKLAEARLPLTAGAPISNRSSRAKLRNAPPLNVSLPAVSAPSVVGAATPKFAAPGSLRHLPGSRDTGLINQGVRRSYVESSDARRS